MITVSNEMELAAIERPVLVKFSAEWCEPCRKLAPVVADLEQEFRSRCSFVHVDVDEAEALCVAHGIRQIPHVKILGGPTVLSFTSPDKEDLAAALRALPAKVVSVSNERTV